MPALPAPLLAHLEAVTGDAERLRDCWAPDGVLEFPYAPAEMTGRIDGIDALVAYFGGPKRWTDWTFTATDVVGDPARHLHVAEVHAEATWAADGRGYVQDYVLWVTLDADGRIQRWREYWDKERA